MSARVNTCCRNEENVITSPVTSGASNRSFAQETTSAARRTDEKVKNKIRFIFILLFCIRTEVADQTDRVTEGVAAAGIGSNTLISEIESVVVTRSRTGPGRDAHDAADAELIQEQIPVLVARVDVTLHREEQFCGRVVPVEILQIGLGDRRFLVRVIRHIRIRIGIDIGEDMSVLLAG